MTLEPCNIVCPNCGNGNYMRHLVGDNVGRLDVKCINCNSYFNFWELHDLQNAPTDEYIARKTIVEELNSRIEQYVAQNQNARARAIADFGRFVREAPAADVVEVVRCKDCVNHHESGLCDGWSRYGAIRTKDDQYCSYGIKVGG